LPADHFLSRRRLVDVVDPIYDDAGDDDATITPHWRGEAGVQRATTTTATTATTTATAMHDDATALGGCHRGPTTTEQRASDRPARRKGTYDGNRGTEETRLGGSRVAV